MAEDTKVDVPIQTIMDKVKDSDWKGMNNPDNDLPIERGMNVDMVNHPPHYTSHPKGIECVDVVEENPYPNLAEAMRYLWRVSWGSKGNKVHDLEKAIWYINRHIANLKSGRAK